MLAPIKVVLGTTNANAIARFTGGRGMVEETYGIDEQGHHGK
jgi:hypothetical protein